MNRTELEIIVVPVTPFQQNARIVFCGGDALVIDPGGDVSLILKEISHRSAFCREVWLTHSHLDHCGGVAQLLAETGATLRAHQEGQLFRSQVVNSCQHFGFDPKEAGMSDCPEPDSYISDGDTLDFAGHTFEVLFTPGHAPDHVSFYHRSSQTLLAGDLLFYDSIGRTDLPGGSMEILLDSVKRKIFPLPDEVSVLPGHGPNTTVGREKSTNPFLQGL
jgi:hydroxyacylglutathione hydrolase